jgi:hypothetical protein
MESGLRRVELVENAGDDTNIQRVDHVVGVDESGNSHDGPFVMVAVQCPRSCGELLAELLIEEGLQPWKSKSSSTPAGVSGDGLSERVRSLLEAIQETPITWFATAGWGTFGKPQRAAIACIVASKAMTGGSGGEIPEYDGPATLMHDGGHQLYGDSQLAIRRAATRQFDGFGDRVTPVYLSFLRDGDKTYPEITAADYIAGYLRSEISDQGISGVDVPLKRIDSSWRASDRDPPTTLYELRTRHRRRQQTKEGRAASWIEGRRPPEDGGWNESPIESLTGRLQSDVVRNYILNEL